MPIPDPHIALAVTVDPLGRRGTTDYLYFGLTLSVGVTGGASVSEAVAALLAPWRWSLEGVSFLQQTGGGAFAPWTAPVDLLDVHAPRTEERPVSGEYRELIRRIDDRWAAGAPERAARARWPAPLTDIEVEEEGDVPPERRPWAIELANYSSLPYPYAQWLNLSVHVRVRWAGTPPGRVVAAPRLVLRAEPGAPGYRVAPGTDGADFEGGSTATGEVLWAYRSLDAPPPPMPLVAHAGIAPAVPESVGAVDGGRLWIRSAGGGVHGEDWRAELMRTASDAFDLPQRIVDALARGLAEAADQGGSADAAAAALWPDILASADLVVATLHDSVAGGARHGPDGSASLLEGWADRAKEDDPGLADELRTLSARPDAADAPPLGEWRKRLRLAAEKAGEAEFKFLRDAYTAADFETPARAVAELSRLVAAARQGKMLAWTLIGTWSTLTPYAERVEMLADEPQTRTYLLQGAVTPYWEAWIAALQAGAAPQAQREKLRRRFWPVLVNGLYLRLGTQPPADTAAVLPLPQVAALAPKATAPAGLPARLRAALGTWGDEEAARLVPEAEEQVGRTDDRRVLFGRAAAQAAAAAHTAGGSAAARLPATRVPHPVAVSLGVLQRDSATPAEDRDDPLRRYSGMVVLMRRRDRIPVDPAPTPRDQGLPWRCLNVARAAVLERDREHPTRFSSTPWGERPLVVSQRPGYRAGLSEAAVVYDNRPLVAVGPEALLGDHGLQAVNGTSEAAEPLLRYHYLDPTRPAPSGHHPGWAKQAGLVFGEVYEVAAFMMPNSGALPLELAEAEAAPGMLALDPLRVKVPGDAVQRVWYPRRVAVGQPRVSAPGQSDVRPLLLPDIPDGVFPRVRELFLRSVEAASTEGPVLLLDPLGGGVPSSYTFEVRRPATDLQTWLRWQSRSLPQAQRAAAVEAYYRALQHNHSHGDSARQPTALDDPAVEQMGAVLQRFDPVGNRWVPVGDGRSERQLWTPLPGDPDALQVPGGDARTGGQRMRIVVESRRGDAAGDSFGPDAGVLRARVAEGQVYRLVVASLVPPAEFQRFDPRRAVGQAPDEPAALFPGWQVMSPWTLWIETATRAWAPPGPAGRPTDEEYMARLYDRLEVEFVPRYPDKEDEAERPEDAIHFTCALPVAGQRDIHPYIHGADLVRQRWYWNGRPVNTDMIPPLSLAGGGWKKRFLDPGSAPVQEWEGAEFGDRDPRQGAPQAMTVRFDERALLPGAEGTRLAAQVWSHRLPLTADPGASYHRVALVVRHRYAGLYGIQPRWAETQLPDSTSRVPWPWHSFLVPCRPVALPAPPSVRLVLPLTASAKEGADSAPGSAGLLVIVRGAAFEHGGLAERFRVGTAEAGNEKRIYEFAPDPIRSPASWSAQVGDNQYGLDRLDVQGPVGHSFDDDSGPRLMVTSAYMISPPRTPAAVDVPYSFIKLRFGRSLDPRLTLPAPGVENNGPDGTVGEWTEGHWAQLLPDHRLVSGGVDVSKYTLAVDGTELVTARVGAEANPVPPGSTHGTVPLLLVTQKVYDVRQESGQARSEAYLGLFRSIGNGRWRWLDGDASPARGAGTGVTGRIVYLQAGSQAAAVQLVQDLNDGTVNEASLWTRIFQPTAPAGSSTAVAIQNRIHILGISAPIGPANP